MSDIFEITNPEILTRIEGINNGTIKDIVISGEPQEIARTVTDTISGGELAEIVDGVYEIPINDGQVNFYHYEGTGFVDAPTTSVTSIQKTVPAGPITQYNSNCTSIQRGRVVQPYNTSVSNGKVNLSATPKTGSFGANAAYFLGEVNQAVCAAQVGIALGKVIDSTLYNANPGFWDSHGMSSLNPATWGSITHGDDSLGAALFNMVFGIDPDTNQGQAYIDQNAFAYMAYYMAVNGVFGESTTQSVIDDSQIKANSQRYNCPISSVEGMSTVEFKYNSTGGYRYYDFSGSAPLYFFGFKTSADTVYTLVCCSKQSFTYKFTYTTNGSPSGNPQNRSSTNNSGTVTSYFNFSASVHLADLTTAFSGNYTPVSMPPLNTTPANIDTFYSTIVLYGTQTQSGGVEGISDQPNATLPDVSTWNDLADTLNSLMQQFPNLWNDAITYDQLQPDGSLKPTTYVPVGWPSTTANPWTDTQPTTTTSPTTQTNPKIDLDDLIDTETSPITRTITEPTTPVPDPTVPQNPSDTGDGSSPVPVVPTGEASALWSVYHPTQAQINSFGAWLWSTNFVDQLLKIFQNPMDAIVSLHKVFVTPTDAGTTTIHAGYLDSGVSSAYVTNQYEYVDCGSVDCHEVFGNVFDYIGTNVSLYLPFIGIVPLNVDEVMRSTINVTYGCDLFTGAILAQVKITRDGNDAIMYQYGGDGGVQYPISGSRSSGFLTGLAAVIGASASIATGGAALPAIGAAFGGSVMSAQKQVQHSGGFTGNAGAMGGKTPYLIIERPQTKTASLFPVLNGYPTNYSSVLGNLSGQVKVSDVHVEGIPATNIELEQIEALLKSGILI